MLAGAFCFNLRCCKWRDLDTHLHLCIIFSIRGSKENTVLIGLHVLEEFNYFYHGSLHAVSKSTDEMLCTQYWKCINKKSLAYY